MGDPVRLPSGKHVDRSSLVQLLLTSRIDPFSRLAVTRENCPAASELRAQIDTWRGLPAAERAAWVEEHGLGDDD